MISYLQTEDFAEREAREKFDLQKPGEKVVVIPRTEEEIKLLEAQSDQNDLNPDRAEKLSGRQTSNLKKWWNYFFAN